ncbi:MAG TPA: 3-hydroxyacyl-CoA dehydrogenase NAD-binding domain-containing protein, partial [Novosphingobium sp.]|nr:3-hydroxyacyl-CoA dehydrogenase NAD-binding domain-containing protein [Novosphingobium sp.]HZV10254.1 3-hydroxyacyl-CoA dehydrogenase NAD-binding domain-containing protein [Novosphingobium sp.]
MAAYRDTARIATVTAIGAGVIGAGWVAAFLGSGRAVRLFDPAPDAAARAAAHVAAAWPQMAALGLAPDHADWRCRLTTHDSLAEATAGTDFVQESTPERLDLKQALLAELDRL